MVSYSLKCLWEISETICISKYKKRPQNYRSNAVFFPPPPSRAWPLHPCLIFDPPPPPIFLTWSGPVCHSNSDLWQVYNIGLAGGPLQKRINQLYRPGWWSVPFKRELISYLSMSPTAAGSSVQQGQQASQQGRSFCPLVNSSQ